MVDVRRVLIIAFTGDSTLDHPLINLPKEHRDPLLPLPFFSLSLSLSISIYLSIATLRILFSPLLLNSSIFLPSIFCSFTFLSHPHRYCVILLSLCPRSTGSITPLISYVKSFTCSPSQVRVLIVLVKYHNI